MADQLDRRFTILWVLVAGLLVAVIVQSVVIFGMNKKLGQQVRTASQPTLSVAKHDHSALRPKALAPAKPADQDKDP